MIEKRIFYDKTSTLTQHSLEIKKYTRYNYSMSTIDLWRKNI